MLYTSGMENLRQLDQQSLQSLLNSSPDTTGINLIPESLTSILTTATYVSLGFMVVFLILYGLNIARKWKVQSAVLKMQKDVAAIKLALAEPAAPRTTAPQSEERKIEIATTSKLE